MSEELPPQTGAPGENETKVIYSLDDEETPYMIKIPIPASEITLGDFKNALNNQNGHLVKYFFKSMDEDIGAVKEEITEDSSKLPTANGRVSAWLVSADGSAHSDGSSGLRRGAKGPRGMMTAPQATGGPGFAAAANAFDQTAATSDTESTISGLPVFQKHGSRLDRRMIQPQYGGGRSYRRGRQTDGDSTITTDSEATRFSDDDRSRISTSTGITSVSQQQQYYRKRKRVRKYKPPPSRTSSISSITESSMSLNIIRVMLNMDTVSFLGISIVGQSNQRGDGGIYVANIMKGGAVALDGRIEPGDMILQVNDVAFENMSNDDAVQVLRDAVSKSGRIELVVAKCWDPAPHSRGYFTVPRAEPVRPIDPGAWVAHTNAYRATGVEVTIPEGGPTPTPGNFVRPGSVNTVTSQNSGSFTSSIPENERAQQAGIEPKLDVGMDMSVIVRAMTQPNSGLDIRERTWLKIKIPNAFLGSEVIDWLMKNVNGLPEKREARKYAAHMLKAHYIKHTVNKITFSEQCYYVFGDSICAEMGRLNLAPQGSSMIPPHLKSQEDGATSDHDTVPPLPPPPTMSPAPWAAPLGMPHGMRMHQFGGPSTFSGAPTHQLGTLGTLGNPNNYNLQAMQQMPTAPSMASGYASLPGAPFGGYPPSETGGSFPSVNTGSTGLGSTPTVPPAIPGAESEVHTAVSNGSNGSSGTGSDKAKPQMKPVAPPKPPMGSLPAPPALIQASGGQSILTEMERDLSGSRQSFKIAMGNPCEFFVDQL